MSNEIKYAPANDPNVQLVADTLVDALGLKILPHVTLVEIAQRVIAKMNAEAGEPEPFYLGNTYRTQDGSEVKFVGYGSSRLIGTSYETMHDEQGRHRYTRRGADGGRLTATNGEFGEGGNVQPLYARPPSYAVPAMTLMVPEGYKILKTTTHGERSYAKGESQYCNTCIDCGREYLGPKMSRVCKVCVNEVEAPLIPTAIHGRGNGAFKIGHFNIFTNVKNDPEYDKASISYGERLVYKKPKEPEEMTFAELSAHMDSLRSLMARRLQANAPCPEISVHSSAPLDGSQGMPT